MSGKSDVVDGGIVESHGARAPGADDRKRDLGSRLPAVRLQHLFDAFQDERPSRAALTRRPRLELTVDAVGDIDSRAHQLIVPYLWRLDNAAGKRVDF